MVALGRGRRQRVTPGVTEQLDIWPNREREPDQQCKCLKHVMLAASSGKNEAKQYAARSPENSRFSAFSIPAALALRDFPKAVPEIPHQGALSSSSNSLI